MAPAGRAPARSQTRAPARTPALRAPAPTIEAIERRIIMLIAQQAGSDQAELERELCLAHPDLPIDSGEALSILSSLEEEFGVELPSGREMGPRLYYARELAAFVHGRLTTRRAPRGRF